MGIKSRELVQNIPNVVVLQEGLGSYKEYADKVEKTYKGRMLTVSECCSVWQAMCKTQQQESPESSGLFSKFAGLEIYTNQIKLTQDGPCEIALDRLGNFKLVEIDEKSWRNLPIEKRAKATGTPSNLSGSGVYVHFYPYDHTYYRPSSTFEHGAGEHWSEPAHLEVHGTPHSHMNPTVAFVPQTNSGVLVLWTDFIDVLDLI